MFKKMVHLFFVITGGTIGYLYIPDIVQLLNFPVTHWLVSPYLDLLLGGMILFLFLYFFADYIVNFLRLGGSGLVKVPVGDLFFGSLGLIIELVIAYLITIPLRYINLQIVSQIIPLFLTILLGYFGFQVGFRRREEFVNLLNVNRKDRDRRKTVDEEKKEEKNPKPKILDTSVIIDGRIADICQTNFL